MSFQERKKKILEALNNFESLSVMEFSEKLAISPATIRRDLHQMAEQKLLTRTHGGAMRLGDPPFTSFVEKQNQQTKNKIDIGKLASGYVKEGDIIFMDCGSTVFTMCLFIKNIPNLKVITNSLPIVAELIDVPTISLNLIGGELDKGRKAIHGEKAINHIDSYHVNKAFIGVDGVSVQNGLTAFSEKEASITNAFIRNADAIFLLCGSSKIGKDSYLKFAPLSKIHHFITDKELTKKNKEELKRSGVNVIS